VARQLDDWTIGSQSDGVRRRQMVVCKKAKVATAAASVPTAAIATRTTPSTPSAGTKRKAPSCAHPAVAASHTGTLGATPLTPAPLTPAPLTPAVALRAARAGGEDTRAGAYANSGTAAGESKENVTTHSTILVKAASDRPSSPSKPRQRSCCTASELARQGSGQVKKRVKHTPAKTATIKTPKYTRRPGPLPAGVVADVSRRSQGGTSILSPPAMRGMWPQLVGLGRHGSSQLCHATLRSVAPNTNGGEHHFVPVGCSPLAATATCYIRKEVEEDSASSCGSFSRQTSCGSTVSLATADDSLGQPCTPRTPLTPLVPENGRFSPPQNPATVWTHSPSSCAPLFERTPMSAGAFSWPAIM